ncbi:MULTISPECIES: ABC transporter permease [unclassified Spirosoma]|uniref:ABC transporter permease n=1 Tax=unclassified Spirosoma TaxID=2621999 RepID=UPI00095FDD54|nr:MULTISPECIES: ABC transporter permease [unclassified Spirosoma]MBN8824358.1 ABC transporter permease [Spirosoma sp.]OJW70179.1 MAG: antibiotic ABC transporter permease [Spirosoma sp. 48-14]
MKKQPIPPRWADWLLEVFVAPPLREDVQGDLHEVFYKRTEQEGLSKARREFIWAVLHYINPYFFKARQRTNRQSDYPSPSYLHPAMLRNYLTIALRTLAHNKAYSIINVVGLSIGLAAAMLIILYTKDEVSYDRFHTNNPNLYRITSRDITPGDQKPSYNTNTGIFQGPKFTAGTPEIQSFVRFQSGQSDIRQGNEVKSQEMFSTDPEFFQLFSFPLLSGDPKTALSRPKTVVISEDMAEKQFGTTDALGKIMFIKTEAQFEPYTVTGVAVKCPQNSSIKFDVLLPITVSKEDIARSDNWFSFFLNTFVLVRPNANIKAVEATMNRIYQTDAKNTILEMAKKFGIKSKTIYSLQPLTEMHLSTDLPVNNGLVDESRPTFSYILSGIALFVLLIACINFVNLTVARSLKRAKEIGVRKVVGGGRNQLIIQFLGESFLLCFVAFVLAIVLLLLVLPTFNQLANKALSFAYLLDVKLIAGYIGLFLVTGLLAGFYPAIVLSGFSPVQSLYSRFRFAGRNYLQRGLIVLQFSLASFLIVATLTINSQLNYLTTKSLGYDDRNLVAVNKSSLNHSEARLLKSELMKFPTIVDVAPKNRGFWGTVAKVNGEKQLSFAYETVDEMYLPLLKIPILAGRNFSPDFPSDSTQSVLVNESFVKEAGWKNPIGQEVNFFAYEIPERYKVIGVVKDYHFAALNQKIRPQLFTMKPKNDFGKAFVKIKPHTETESLRAIEQTFKKLFPINPYSYSFLDQDNLKKYESEAKWRQIMLFGAILTIFISCIGLLGLATLAAERRTKEIGIRKVLGASVSSIVQLLSSDFLRLVGFSFVLAFPAAYFAIDKWLENYPYRIEISAWTFALAALLAILIAFFTVSFQSIRAAMSNPVKSLRSE